MSFNNEIPQEEEISPIVNGFPVETASQARQREAYEKLQALRSKYFGGFTNTANNVVSALRHDALTS